MSTNPTSPDRSVIRHPRRPHVRRLDANSAIGRRHIVAEYDYLVDLFGDPVGHLPANIAPLGDRLVGLLAATI